MNMNEAGGFHLPEVISDENENENDRLDEISIRGPG